MSNGALIPIEPLAWNSNIHECTTVETDETGSLTRENPIWLSPWGEGFGTITTWTHYQTHTALFLALMFYPDEFKHLPIDYDEKAHEECIAFLETYNTDTDLPSMPNPCNFEEEATLLRETVLEGGVSWADDFTHHWWGKRPFGDVYDLLEDKGWVNLGGEPG